MENEEIENTEGAQQDEPWRNLGAFKKGNEAWTMRASHGRDRIFDDPMAMWDAAVEYFTWADETPLIKVDFIVANKAIKKVKQPVRRPYTLMALCLFWGVSTGYLRTFKVTTLLNMPEAKKRDFLAVIERIEEAIYNQKFEGAASGFFNANIISRDLGLADKKEVKANIYGSDTPLEFD